MFALKLGIDGNASLSLQEQNMLTAEDRKWWYEELQRVANERNKKQSGSIPHLSKPRIPRR